MDDLVRSTQNLRTQELGCLPIASRKIAKSRMEPAITSSRQLLEEQDRGIREL